MRKRSQAGNAVLFVLIGIALFGALAATFMRGNKSGTGNLTANQARLKAQELMDFLTVTERGFQRLRQKGCSENDISFAYTGTNGNWGSIIVNHPTTAPVDFSCHVFRPEGGGVNFNIDPETYQLPYSWIDTHSHANVMQHDNVQFRMTSASTIGVGTNDNDLMMHFNFIQPEICKAFNQILGFDIDPTVIDSGPILGDENVQYVGKSVVCRFSADIGSTEAGQIRYIWIPK